jgi:S-adenosylmethionine hydrolase
VKPIALLTDFGLGDAYVGVLHAVLIREAGEAQRFDISHGVPPGDIWTGCYLLRYAWPDLPPVAVVLAVVDPGVGTVRRAVAAQVGERWIVAPDNGLPAAVGTPARCFTLDPERLGAQRVSATFHGRDLFAPAVARLSRGEDPHTFATPCDPAAVVPCPLPGPRREGATIHGVVLHVDRFGNLITNIPWTQAPPGAELRAGWRRVLERSETYADAPPGKAVLMEGSSGLLEIAVNGASAAELPELDGGDPVEIHLPPDGTGSA